MLGAPNMPGIGKRTHQSPTASHKHTHLRSLLLKGSVWIMPKQPIFISRLYSYRILEPISQIDLAKELGLTRQAIAAIETGRQQPSLHTAFRLAQYFKTPIESLFSFKERG